MANGEQTKNRECLRSILADVRAAAKAFEQLRSMIAEKDKEIELLKALADHNKVKETAPTTAKPALRCGWICPRCGYAMAPHVAICPNCIGQVIYDSFG